MDPAAITRGIDHAAQQGLVWFLVAVIVVLLVVGMVLGKCLLTLLREYKDVQFNLLKETTTQIALNNRLTQEMIQILNESKDMMKDTRQALQSVQTATDRQVQILSAAAQSMTAVVGKIEGMRLAT